MLAGVWALYAGFGLVVGSMAPLVTPIQDDLGLDRGDMGVILGAWQFVFLGTAIPAGRLIDRVGLRRALAVAGLVLAASGFLRAIATDFWSLLAAVALFGFGAPLVSIGAPKLVSVWFSHADRRIAVGIYATAPSIGVTVALATANAIVMPLTDDSWRATMSVYAGLVVLALIAWVVVAARAPFPEAVVSEASPSQSSRQLLRIPVVQLVLALAVGAFFYSHAIGNWLVEMLRDEGKTASAAGVWASVPAFVGIVGTLMAPRFAVPTRRVPLLVGLFLLGGVGVVGVISVDGVALALALVAVGIARTAVVPIAVLVLMDDRRIGAASMAAAGGLFFTAGEVGGVVGPLVTGVLADSSGGFGLPVGVLVGVLGAMALLSTALGAVHAPAGETDEPQEPAT